jgi:PAS domain S-box-containing protein
MWVCDRETRRFLAVNQATVDRYGYSRAELLAMTIEDIRPPADVPASMAHVAGAEAGAAVSGPSRHRRKDGTLIDVEVASRPLDFDGRPAELVVPVDVTGRSGSDGELRRVAAIAESAAQSERHFRLLIENVSDVIAEVDERGEVRYVNPAVEQVIGYDSAEVVGRSIFDWVHPEDLAAARDSFSRRLAADRGPAVSELRFRHRDSSWRVLQTRGTVLHDIAPAPMLVLLARDVTMQKDLEARLRQAQKMEAIGRLAGGVAHDFNNLLTSILGHSELALHGVGEDAPLRDHLEQISAAGERAAALTRQLLAYGRRQLVLPQTLDLGRVAAELAKMLRRLLPEDVALEIAGADTVQLVTADRSQLEQVLMNLVLNARDAMPEGGRITVGVAAVEVGGALARRHPELQPGPHVLLAVTDTGIGMDEETQKRIFEPFFTTKDPARGTGLGLPSVYAMVEQNRGAVAVESAPGRGTTVSVYLPRTTAAAATAADGEDAIAGGDETILLVEDDDQVRAMAFRVLSARGYHVLSAASGVEAERLFRDDSGLVQLLLTDVVMPGMTGPDLAARLRRLVPALAVVYMSGHADEAILRRGLRGQGETLVQKPFRPAALARKVREVLDRAPGRRS